MKIIDKSIINTLIPLYLYLNECSKYHSCDGCVFMKKCNLIELSKIDNVHLSGKYLLIGKETYKITYIIKLIKVELIREKIND